jgi:HEAT repeat protein
MRPDIYRLIAELEHLAAKNRCRAAEELGLLGSTRAIGPLIDRLEDHEWEVRQAATSALTNIGAPAVAPLCDELASGGAGPREQAVIALGRIGAPAAEPTAHLLGHEDPRVRAGASEVLRAIGLAACDPVCDLIRHGSLDVRASALELAGAIGGVRVGPLLLGALDDPEEQIRAAALRGLAALGDREVAPTLLAKLRTPGWQPADWAAFACARLGSDEAAASIAALLHAALGRAGNLPSTSWTLRMVQALGMLGDGASVSVLRSALTFPLGQVRREAARALGVLASRSAPVEARSALPALRRLIAPWSREERISRDVYHETIDRIEAATTRTASLPRPGRPPEPDDLPVPAAPDQKTGSPNIGLE